MDAKPSFNLESDWDEIINMKPGRWPTLIVGKGLFDTINKRGVREIKDRDDERSVATVPQSE